MLQNQALAVEARIKSNLAPFAVCLYPSISPFTLLMSLSNKGKNPKEKSLKKKLVTHLCEHTYAPLTAAWNKIEFNIVAMKMMGLLALFVRGCDWFMYGSHLYWRGILNAKLQFTISCLVLSPAQWNKQIPQGQYNRALYLPTVDLPECYQLQSRFGEQSAWRSRPHSASERD